MKKLKDIRQKLTKCEHNYVVVIDTPSSQTLKCTKCGKLLTDVINDIFKDAGWED